MFRKMRVLVSTRCRMRMCVHAHACARWKWIPSPSFFYRPLSIRLDFVSLMSLSGAVLSLHSPHLHVGSPFRACTWPTMMCHVSRVSVRRAYVWRLWRLTHLVLAMRDGGKFLFHPFTNAPWIFMKNFSLSMDYLRTQLPIVNKSEGEKR